MEPTAVTSQETIESAPTYASLDGSMMMPEPIILTAVKMVSWNTLILFELLLMITSLIGRDPGFRRGSPFPPLLYYFSNSFLKTYP